MCFYSREQLLCAVTNYPFLVLIAWDQDIVVSRQVVRFRFTDVKYIC